MIDFQLTLTKFLNLLSMRLSTNLGLNGRQKVGEALRKEFPLLDEIGLDQELHHCEWSIQQERKRLHQLLDELQTE